jgi:ABC-2 type transport system ATP-binding protein
MIEADNLTKTYGGRRAVDRLSFRIEPGRVTGFLGPNGAGKSTTIRLILGLDAPTGGRVLVAGQPYRALRRPLRQVGVLLDANAVHGGRRARDHLGWLARTNDVPRARIGEVLRLTGLADAAHRRVGGFSLGMKQRLGIAAALLGDPGILILDEPVNGLDPDGVHWIRGLMRSLAAEGRTVLISSHLMSEMQLTADQLLIIGRGRLIADTSVRELAEQFTEGVLVRSARPEELAGVLRAAGGEITTAADGALTVRGLDQQRIGDLAAGNGIPIYEAAVRSASLEDAYLSLTAGTVQFGASENRTVSR